MTRLTHFVIMSFSILDNDDVMSSKGNYTLAVVKGEESYDLLKSSFKDLFHAINNIIKEKKVRVNDIDIPVEIFLGGDYKFLLLIMGMKGATADYACIWCTIHKSNRHDMSKPEKFYLQEENARTLNKIKEDYKTRKLSCEHQPLLDIELDNIVIDELHLMLRVTDVLTKNLVTEAIEWDTKENLNKAPSQRTNTHLDQLKEVINSCGVSFNVWEKKNGDGKGSGIYDFTSLMGSDKKLLLESLPSKLKGIIKPTTSDTVIKLWKDFGELYGIINAKITSDTDISKYFKKATQWISLFTSIGGTSTGYQKARVTPYMHGMVYHVPHFMRKHTGVKQFTGQGVEKNNDDCRRIHLQKSNKWDAAKDVLLVSKRLEALASYERTPRSYLKRNAEYWGKEIKEKRAKQKLSTKTTRMCEEEEPNTENMSPKQLKDALKQMGVITRVRNVKRLQELYVDAMREQQK
ncbi:uncharacterized protein LOC114575505 [Exaiptasia diaphana]|uniref:Uncharacterized protein n=2 Tax=Exaiptasia diaphana TaxID=2652724 RepID=A0A913YMM7_EXADI|nr:uncharacterized protein LOC114575505 [Exaiptasia diaphana]